MLIKLMFLLKSQEIEIIFFKTYEHITNLKIKNLKRCMNQENQELKIT